MKAEEAIPTPPYPKFLTLPFQDTEIRIVQGWLYNWGKQPNYHYAIDYVKGIGKGRWVTFDVLAAAEGEAKYVGYFPKSKEGRYNYGHLVQVRHPYYDSAGNQFYTLYAHLSEVSGKLAILSEDGKLVSLGWVPVERGEYLGKAGESGAEGSGIHLHFEVQVSESLAKSRQTRVDPYGIYAKVEPGKSGYPYPPAGDCPEDCLWITCPPAPFRLNILGTASVAFFKGNIHVVGTTTGELYVLNEIGQYTFVKLSASPIKDVRVASPFIVVATGNEVIKLKLTDIGPSVEELWRKAIPAGWLGIVSVDISSDGNYIAYLAHYDSVGVLDSEGNIIASHSIVGSWIAHWLDATDDMEYIAITAEVGPYYWGENTGVELYRFDRITNTLENIWSVPLIYRYETTEVRISENKDYIAVATSSGTVMNLLRLSDGAILWSYDAGQEQFAVGGDENLKYVIGGTQYDYWVSPTPPYKWFLLHNLGEKGYKLLIEGTMTGSVNDLDATLDGRYFAFGSDAGEFILLEKKGTSIEPVLSGNVRRLIDAIGIGSKTLLVGGEGFIYPYPIP